MKRTSLIAKAAFLLLFAFSCESSNNDTPEQLPVVPTQTGIQVVCPDGMTGNILLQSDSEENANLNGYEGISRSLRSVSSPIYQNYNQLLNEGRLYNGEVEALRTEAKTASPERANEIWLLVDKLKNLDESYSEEGLVAKKELDAFNAMLT